MLPENCPKKENPENSGTQKFEFGFGYPRNTRQAPQCWRRPTEVSSRTSAPAPIPTDGKPPVLLQHTSSTCSCSPAAMSLTTPWIRINQAQIGHGAAREESLPGRGTAAAGRRPVAGRQGRGGCRCAVAGHKFVATERYREIEREIERG